MAQTRELTCICCPLGCQIVVALDGESVLGVQGNSCPRGDQYARKEVTHPTRTVTTTVPVTGGGPVRRVPVKTAADIPKALMLDCMRELARVSVAAPVFIGDVVLPDVCGTGVDVVATANIAAVA